MSTPITRHQCDHCPKHYAHKRSATAHEKHCWANPRREPREGEVYGVDHGGNFADHDAPEVMPWEPPRRGLIFVHGRWLPVKGYVWRHECSETWPLIAVDGATPLNKAPRSERVRWFLGHIATVEPGTPSTSEDIPF